LVLPDVNLREEPRAPTFHLVAIHDPRYREPLLLVSNLTVSPEALWRLYRDRWAIEQLPLAAKSMLGAERSFVFGTESRYRLPEMALLAGNLLSYVAATSAPVTTGFWDRAARPTCGRLRRMLARAQWDDLEPCSEPPCSEPPCSEPPCSEPPCSEPPCSEFVHSAKLPVMAGQLRRMMGKENSKMTGKENSKKVGKRIGKKNSVTAHLKTGVEAHRRCQATQAPSEAAHKAAFTGN
jgi:hypothetical protein